MTDQKTILCVDDDAIARLIIQKFIKHAGNYKSVEAKNGQDCLDFVSQNKVDLIILDYNLGDISGYDVCKLIPSRSKNPEVPIIISSVLSSDTIRRKCVCDNLLKVVQKPYDLDLFHQDIEEALGA